MFVVFDLDGTLCDVSHRLHFIQEQPKDWDAFFSSCIDDAPKLEIIHTLNALDEAGHRVEIWTGRSDVTFRQTIQWLNKHVANGSFSLGLKMRPAGDYRPDHELKREWLMEGLKLGTAPDLVFEDRQRVVDMWRSENITCCQVDAWEEH